MEAQIEINPYWQAGDRLLQQEIEEKGIEHFQEFDTIRRNMLFGDYKYPQYAKACSEYLWPNRDPERIVEFGAGYGGMSLQWPYSARFVNIDLPGMLQVQKHYIERVGLLERAEFVELGRISEVDFNDAYFFSAYALTETSPSTWEWFFRHVFPSLKGIFIRGGEGWYKDDPVKQWPWGRLREMFEELSWEKVRVDHPEWQFVGRRKDESNQ